MALLRIIPQGQLVLALLFIFCGMQSYGYAKGEQRFYAEKIIEGKNIIWGMDFLSENQLIYSEKHGKISVLDLTTLTSTPLSDVPIVMSDGQGGLMDIVVSPTYKNDGWIYITYVKPIGEQGVTVLARAKKEHNRLTDWQDVYLSSSATDTAIHYGSRITFDYKGYLYFTVGDRGVRPNAQDLTNDAGKVIRLHLDGTIPKDNPFMQHTQARKGIYSFGHRNPQGITYDRINNRLWLIEHGPRGGDEINLILKGRNYGWPVVSHGKEYWGPAHVGEATEKKGMESPVKVYIPSIAPGSLLVYSGKSYKNWQGNLFAGALKLRHLNRISLDNQGEVIGEERLFTALKERIRAIRESPKGIIYFSTDSGKIYRILHR